MYKTPFTETEIEELNDLYQNHGRDFERSETITFLKKKFGYSNVHTVICELRKEQLTKSNKMWEEFRNKYSNSTLNDKLIKRIDENEL